MIGRGPLASRNAGGRGALAIMGGTAAGQALAVLVTPILSRQYSPADFGVLAIVTALAVTLGTTAALRYELAIPLPESDADAHALVRAGFAISCALTAFTTVGAFAFASEISGLFQDQALAAFIPVVPLVAFSFATFRLLNQWALRQQRYAATARRNFLQSVSTVAIQLLAGWRGLGAGGLVLGLGGGQTIGAASLTIGSGLFRRGLRRSSPKVVLWRYRRFAYFLAPAGLVNALGVYVPLLMIAAWYGTTSAGHLGFTQRILGLPLALIGQAVAQVYLSELAFSRREGVTDEARLFRQASLRLAFVAAAGALVLLVAGPWIFETIFGPQWTVSGEFARALAVSVCVQLVAVPVSQTLVGRYR